MDIEAAQACWLSAKAQADYKRLCFHDALAFSGVSSLRLLHQECLIAEAEEDSYRLAYERLREQQL